MKEEKLSIDPLKGGLPQLYLFMLFALLNSALALLFRNMYESEFVILCFLHFLLGAAYMYFAISRALKHTFENYNKKLKKEWMKFAQDLVKDIEKEAKEKGMSVIVLLESRLQEKPIVPPSSGN